jgi:hypothetical protein
LLREALLPVFRTGKIAVSCRAGVLLRSKICPRTSTNISEQNLIKKPGMSSTPSGLDSLRCLIALETSDSETGAKDKNSEDEEMAGKTTGQGLLYTD